MSDTNSRNTLQQEYNRLKNLLKKILNPKKQEMMPQLALRNDHNRPGRLRVEKYLKQDHPF